MVRELTAEDVWPLLGEQGGLGWNVAEAIAALVAERTAAAVDAARREEREACEMAIKRLNATVKTQGHYEGACMALEAIRARGEQVPPGSSDPSATGPDEAWIAEIIGECNDVCETPEWAARAIADRLRAREAAVARLVEVAREIRGLGIPLTGGTPWAAEKIAVIAVVHGRVLDALDALGETR